MICWSSGPEGKKYINRIKKMKKFLDIKASAASQAKEKGSEFMEGEGIVKGIAKDTILT